MGALLHGRIAAHARIDEPKIIFTVREKAEKKQAATGAPDLAPMLRKVLPARVDRIDIHDGEFLFRDLVMDNQPINACGREMQRSMQIAELSIMPETSDGTRG